MGEVKRYMPTGPLVALTSNRLVLTEQGCTFVKYDDYATLEAENAKLRAELERRAPDGWKAAVEIMAKAIYEERNDYEETPAHILNAIEAYEMLAAAPASPKADDPVKVQLLEALSKAAHYMEQMQDEIDGLINYAGGTGGFGEYEKHIEAVRAAIAAAPSAPKADDPVKVQLLEALEAACDVLDSVKWNINPERGYADELEADVSRAYDAASAAIAAARKGEGE